MFKQKEYQLIRDDQILRTVVIKLWLVYKGQTKMIEVDLILTLIQYI